MKAGIITIGDELLIGQVVDTNSTWISSRLDESGARVVRRLTVGDDGREISEAFDDAFGRCDLIVVTGGLGPTKDDITKTTLAEYFGCPMVEDAETLLHLEAMLARRGIEFNALNRSQAMVPACCKVLKNDNGTAPGMWFERDGKVLVSLPGVPFEMESLMEREVLPRLREFFDLGDIVHKTVGVYGLPESVLAAAIAEWESALPPYIKLAYLPSPSCVRLRLSAYDTGRDRAVSEIEKQFARLEKIIPDNLLGGSDSLAGAVGEYLAKRGETLAVAESCTGGAICGSLTAVAGASAYFRGGVVAYSNEVKINQLGVDPMLLERHGAVSEEVVIAMAGGARRLLGSDYSIATSGVAGPGGGTAEKPVGTVWIAVAGPWGVVAQKRSFGNLRRQNIERATAAAIDMLRTEIKKSQG